MYASARLDHYLTYATLVDELRLAGQSIRAARRDAMNVRRGGRCCVAKPSYVNYPIIVSYNESDATYVAMRELSN